MNYKVNRYTGRFAPSGKTVIDAPSMSIAVQKMVAEQGEEPIQVNLDERNISVVLDEPQVTFETVVKMIDGSLEFDPGNVYPESFTVSQGASVVFTAVPKAGFKFIHFIDMSTSKVLSKNSVASIMINKDITIGAIFEELN